VTHDLQARRCDEDGLNMASNEAPHTEPATFQGFGCLAGRSRGSRIGST
jgi:hypothetical protein